MVPSEQYDNEAKTKEVVFQRPRPKRLHMNQALDGVELVQNAKLLGVILLENVSVEMHVNYHCVVKKYLLKRVRDQVLDQRHLDLIFHAIAVSCMLYASPSWGSFMSKEQTGRINVCIKLRICLAKSKLPAIVYIISSQPIFNTIKVNVNKGIILFSRRLSFK